MMTKLNGNELYDSQIEPKKAHTQTQAIPITQRDMGNNDGKIEDEGISAMTH